MRQAEAQNPRLVAVRDDVLLQQLKAREPDALGVHELSSQVLHRAVLQPCLQFHWLHRLKKKA